MFRAFIFVLGFVASFAHLHALKCYECSSKMNSSCGDPFKKDDFLLTDCPPAPEHIQHFPDVHARVCRKLKQTIDGKLQIITRSCGYLVNSESKTPCFKDAFSSFSSSIYCDCSGDGCNRANNSVDAKYLMTSSILFVFAIKYLFNTG